MLLGFIVKPGLFIAKIVEILYGLKLEAPSFSNT